MKELSLEEISLLEEMKSNCLKKGQYIDEKAKDKFNMLCHLEDFGIAYYELLDVIKEARKYVENVKEEYSVSDVVNEIGIPTLCISIELWKKGLLEILDKENNNEQSNDRSNS